MFDHQTNLDGVTKCYTDMVDDDGEIVKYQIIILFLLFYWSFPLPPPLCISFFYSLPLLLTPSPFFISCPFNGIDTLRVMSSFRQVVNEESN